MLCSFSGETKLAGEQHGGDGFAVSGRERERPVPIVESLACDNLRTQVSVLAPCVPVVPDLIVPSLEPVRGSVVPASPERLAEFLEIKAERVGLAAGGQGDLGVGNDARFGDDIARA